MGSLQSLLQFLRSLTQEGRVCLGGAAQGTHWIVSFCPEGTALSSLEGTVLASLVPPEERQTSSRHACNPFLSLGSGLALQSTAFRLSPPNWRHPTLRLRRQGNSVRHPVEGFQEAALLRVNICSALGLGQSITARGPSHSDHRTPISGTHSHRLGEPHLTLAVVCCPPSFIPRLETGPGREQVRMP